MNPFVRDFVVHAVLGGAVAVVWFGAVGWWLSALLLPVGRLKVERVLLAPALGLCAFGAYSLVGAVLFGYSRLVLLAAWILFALATWFVSRKARAPHEPEITKSNSSAYVM